MRRARRTLLAFAMTLLPLARLTGQQTSLLPSSDLAYLDIDRLSELGVLDNVIIGQRPYSRREIARIAARARERMESGEPRLRSVLGEDASSYADHLIRRLERRFRDASNDLGAMLLLDEALLTASKSDAERRKFPAVHSNPTEATIDPLATRRLGRQTAVGLGAALEAGERIELTPWLAVQARERVEGREPFGNKLSKPEILLASARMRIGNASLTIGRTQTTWSQTPDQGLFLASDAPALDGLVLASDQPFRFPGFLRGLGASKAMFVLADLGASVVRSHSKLLTYKVSVSPSSALEFGGTFFNHFGGTGAASSSLLDRTIDFLPFIDVFRRHNYFDSTRTLDVDSDKAIGLDGRMRIGGLKGIVVTGEVLLDDFDIHRLDTFLTGLGSQTFALVVPQMGSPKLSAVLSAKHLGPLTYTHNAFLNGSTTRGRLLGDELGTDAKSFGAQLRLTPYPSLRLQIEGRRATYSNADYTSFFTDSAHVHFLMRKVANRGDEIRDIGLATLMVQSDDGLALTIRGGGQRIRNSGFTGGTRYDYVAEIALRLAP